MDSKSGAKDYVGIRKALAGQSLGELEAQILDIIWDLDEKTGAPVTTTQVFKIMYPQRELSYSTIMLTMAKLSRKGILDQERAGDKKTDQFFYRPKINRTEMGLALIDAVALQILKKPFDEALADLTESDEVGFELRKLKASTTKLGAQKLRVA